MAGIFPTLSVLADARYYGVKQEDPALKSDMEGGYVASRARYTRQPRKMFKTGFTGMSQVDKETLMAFWDTQFGTSGSFDWTDPSDAVDYVVRFESELNFTYVGIGEFVRYDVVINFEQV